MKTLKEFTQSLIPEELISAARYSNSEDVQNLYEGLIFSVSRDRFISYIHSVLGARIDRKGKFLVYVTLDYSAETKSKLDTYLKISGWYIASVKVDDLYTTEIEAIGKKATFLFEPKFDVLYVPQGRYLYHVCPASSVKKILEKGLSPRSKSKQSYHPDRVYLLLSEQDLDYFDYKLSRYYKDEDVAVYLKIDTLNISKYTQFFVDPNSVSEDEIKGVFTYSNIPPAAISQI